MMRARSQQAHAPAQPKVSVVMSVYNGARYVQQAVDSILSQSFQDLEFVVVDDGSTDDTMQILAAYDDPRLVLVENERNLGLTRSLNRGIALSRGELIARQDADDISLPQRLQRQIAYLDAHPGVGLLGSGSRWIDADGNIIRESRPPTEPARLQAIMLGSVPFLHGTFVFRRECLADLGGGYDERMPVAQDCDLFLRLSERWDVANLPDILYVHRRHGHTVTASRLDEQIHYLRLAQQATIKRRLAYGRARLGLPAERVPAWVEAAPRRWLARRFAWWSAGARYHGQGLALQFLIIALLLDPTAPDSWRYVAGVLSRKARTISRLIGSAVFHEKQDCTRGSS